VGSAIADRPAPPASAAASAPPARESRARAPPAARSAPPTDGTTPWAPSRDDPEWVNVRDFGAVGDDVADDTRAFRKAAATGKRLFVPKPKVAYKVTGFVRVQSSVYGDGSMPEIRMHGADGDPDQGLAHTILVIDGYTGPGLVVNGLRLNGQWDGVGDKGEWSHCVRITSSRNVTVQNCVLERPYGDCIFVGHYVGGSAPAFAPSNIVIQDNVLRGPRRCCVAIISGTDVAIRKNQIQKTSDYVAAIDLEPDPLGYQHVYGVTISDNVFEVVPLQFGSGAVNLNNPQGNGGAPQSGNVSITRNRGTWTPPAAYLRVAGSTDGLVAIVPHLPWTGVKVSDNSRRR
jgi:hypothetical protein